jgi:hypothetical protein
MAGRIDQNQGPQHAGFGKRQGNQGLLEGQSQARSLANKGCVSKAEPW